MASSLDSLVGNLTKSGLEKLKETKKRIWGKSQVAFKKRNLSL